MSNDDRNICEHVYPVIDEHEGTVVCGSCGFVLENELYLYNDFSTIEDNTKNVKEYNNNSDVLELLHRLNLPSDILHQLPNHKQNVTNLYDAINKVSVVTTKEFCAASGIKAKKLVKSNQNKIMNTDVALLLEKYCRILEFSYKDYTLIKETIDKRKESGHPPLTVIGYFIFEYCKKNKIKTSMLKICSTLGISTVSIRRYRKHELSCRS
jgi:transcription initiation factor TFIIIB Brf1 subunit/transcription initiation factor TFIIB